MDLSLLDTLKDKLVHAERFSEVIDYFFDHFGESPEFIAQGERTTDPFLESVLVMVGKQIFSEEVRVDHLLLTRLPEQQFLHGVCTLNGQLANVFYFDDIHVGMIAVLLSAGRGETKLVRFSGRRMPPGAVPSAN